MNFYIFFLLYHISLFSLYLSQKMIDWMNKRIERKKMKWLKYFAKKIFLFCLYS